VEVQGAGELILVVNDSCDKQNLVCGCIMTTNGITKYQNCSVNLDFPSNRKAAYQKYAGSDFFFKYVACKMVASIKM
jgi:hypothetical protein